MSKVRINDLAREMEVKSRQILDILAELGLATGKTHSSSLESDEAEKVRTHFERGLRSAGHASASSSRAPQAITPKIDLSHISKPGDVLKAILAKKMEDEGGARHPQIPAKAPVATVVHPPVRTAPPTPPVAVVAPPPVRPEPRRIVPQPRSAPQIIHPPAPPAIASRPPVGPVVAKAPAGAVVPTRPVVVVAPPAAAVVVKPPVVAVAPTVAPVKEEQPRPAEKPVVAVKPAEAPAAVVPAPVVEASVVAPPPVVA